MPCSSETFHLRVDTFQKRLENVTSALKNKHRFLIA